MPVVVLMRASLVAWAGKAAASSGWGGKGQLSPRPSGNGRVDTPGMRPRVTIGDFSRASHLSIKTLRHYHEVGLLEPAEVDPGNGYRYYAEAQIPQAQVIRRLRGWQMPVAEVRAVLSASDAEQRNRLILDHLERLEAELDRTRAAVSELRDLIARSDDAPDVERRSVPATPAVAISETVP